MQETGGFSVFRMRVREASDDQKAEQNEGATAEKLAVGYVSGESRMISKFLA